MSINRWDEGSYGIVGVRGRDCDERGCRELWKIVSFLLLIYDTNNKYRGMIFHGEWSHS